METVQGLLDKKKQAAIDVDLKIYAAMKQLLTANDVKRDAGMRTNILEIMNELRRFTRERLEATDANQSIGDRLPKAD
jgi:hypothetical protein